MIYLEPGFISHSLDVNPNQGFTPGLEFNRGRFRLHLNYHRFGNFSLTKLKNKMRPSLKNIFFVRCSKIQGCIFS